MDMTTAAAYFDTHPAYDAYSGALLFLCQPDLYDTSERDSNTGWRRSLSAAAITVPARGCITLGSNSFIAGRIVEDFFEGAVIRQHLIIHPSDGLLQVAPASTFLAVGTPTSMHAAISWVKDRKEETTSSRTYAACEIYCHESETLTPGWILKDTSGEYYRLEGVSVRSGGLKTGLAYSLGVPAFRTVSYVVAGVYDPVTDSSTAGTPSSPKAFVEDYATNYQYIVNAAEKYEKADKIMTILKTAVTSPKPGDKVTSDGIIYNIISRQSDGLSWVLHVRPV